MRFAGSLSDVCVASKTHKPPFVSATVSRETVRAPDRLRKHMTHTHTRRKPPLSSLCEATVLTAASDTLKNLLIFYFDLHKLLLFVSHSDSGENIVSRRFLTLWIHSVSMTFHPRGEKMLASFMLQYLLNIERSCFLPPLLLISPTFLPATCFLAAETNQIVV